MRKEIKKQLQTIMDQAAVSYTHLDVYKRQACDCHIMYGFSDDKGCSGCESRI